MAKRKWRNIDPLKAPNIILRQGMKPNELIALWEGSHMQCLYAEEWLENLYDEYVMGEVPNDGQFHT